jgi:hypothetical protein
MIDRDSYGTVQAMRATFDVLSGYKKAKKRGTLGENEVRAGWARCLSFLLVVAA